MDIALPIAGIIAVCMLLRLIGVAITALGRR